jgi:hypothetical protein
MPISDPRDISGLVLWYSAEAETGYSNGASMTGWTDQSGNGNHATAQGTLAPQWESASGSGGGAAVKFRGTHGSTSATWGYFSLPASVMGSASAGEIHASIKSDGQNCSLWGLGLTAGTSAASHYPFDSAIYEGFGTNSRKTVGFPEVAITDWRRYNVWSAAGDWSARIDAFVEFSTSSNTVLWDAAPVIGHGKRNGALSTNVGSFQGRIGAVVLYNRKLTTTERNDLDAWLAANPSGGTPAVSTPTVELDGALTAPGWTLGGSFDLDPTPLVYDLDMDGTLAAPSWALDASFDLAPHAGLDLSGEIAAPAWALAGSFSIAVPMPSDLELDGALAAPGWDLTASFDLAVTPVPADIELAGTVPAPEWTVAGTFALDPVVDSPLAEFVSLYGSTEMNGSGHLVETGADPSMLFILPSIVLDPATTYTVTVDFINAVGDSRISLYSSIGPTHVDADASQWLEFAHYSEGFGTPSGTLGETGPFEFTIGPGVADYDAAMTAGETYVIFQLNNMEVTAITVAPAGTEDPVGADADNDAYKLTLGGWGVVDWEPAIVPAPVAAGGVAARHAVMSAIAYGPVTMNGTQPVFTYSEADAPRLRQRILLAGRDVTYDRGVPTPDVEYELADLLLYGPGTLDLPAYMASWEIGDPATDHTNAGRRVKVQLVDDLTDPDNPTVVATTYKAFVLNPGINGRHLSLELGGEAQGRLALRDSHVLFRDVLDISRLIWRELTDVGVRYLPRLGEPGIGIRSLNFGGTGKLEKVEELLARAVKKDGTQRVVQPDDQGVYRITDKDTTTVHFSVFVDDAFTVANLSSDISEKSNTIYATAIAPNGMRIDGAAVPGLISTPAPPYPMDDDSYFGVGTTNEDTDSGDGISIMVNRLGAVGLLDIRDTPGGYDDDVADAIDKLGRKARATAPVGTMTPELWSALWDLDATGRSGRWSSVQPTAQDPSVQRYRRSASGAPIGLNPDRDPDAIQVDESIDMGTGFKERQVQNWAETRVHAPDEKVLYGTITVNLGAVLAGQVDVGDTITAADLVDARLVKPGVHNLWVPNLFGGTLFGVSGAQVDGESVVFAVDTRHRPARQIWERLQVRRDTRSDPARRMLGTRQSTQRKDAVRGFISWGGIVDRNVPLEPGWNIVEVVVGDHGTLSWLDLTVQTVTNDGGTISIEGHEFALAIFGKPITAARLNQLVPTPLAENGDRPWRRRATRQQLAEHDYLVSFGTQDEPCGYDADLKSDGAPLTGRFVEDAGVTYDVENYVAHFGVYVREGVTDAKLLKGRIAWPVLEGGV